MEAIYCLGLAWHMGCTHAVEASLKQIDDKGYTLEAKVPKLLGGTTDVILTKKFNNPKSKEEIIADIKKRVLMPTFPVTPISIGTVTCWLAALLSALSGSLPSFLAIIREFLLLNVFGSSVNAVFMMKLVFCIHFVELVYDWYLLRCVKLSVKELLSWSLLIMLLGYPVTLRAQALNAVASVKRKE